jgi:Na+-driven multidrug efflux pump
VKKKVFCRQKFNSMMTTASIMLALLVLSEMIDILIAGHLFSGRSISSIHLISPLILVSTFVSMMVVAGTAHHYAYEMGRFKKKLAEEAAGQGLILAAICSVFLLILAFVIKDNFLESVTHSTRVARFAWPYYTFIPYQMAIYPFFFLLQELTYADGGGKRCVIATVLQMAVNICASYLLGKIMGMAGLSLGNLLGFLTSILVYITWFFDRRCSIRFKLHFDGKEILDVFRFSYAHSSLALYSAVSRMALNKFIAIKFEDYALAVLTVVSNVMEISVLFEGIGQAAEPMINIYYGEKNPDGIRKMMRHAVKAALVEGIAVALIFVVLSHNLPKLYGIHPQFILDMCSTALHIIAPAMPLISLMLLFAVYYSVTGHLGTTMLIVLVQNLVFATLFPIALGSMWGLNGFWAGMLLAYVFTFALFALYLLGKHGRKFPLLLEKKDIVSRDDMLYVESLMEIRNWAGKECNKRGISSKVRTKLEVMIEDLGMLIIEKNKNRPVLVEITISFKRDIKVVMRDDGVLYDVTNPDAALSFRSMFVSGLLKNGSRSCYLFTQNYNRNVFSLDKQNT